VEKSKEHVSAKETFVKWRRSVNV